MSHPGPVPGTIRGAVPGVIPGVTPFLVLAAAMALFLPGAGVAQAPAAPRAHPTPAEKADFRAFTAPGEIGPYLARLAAESDGVTLDSLPAPAPLPILRIAARPESGNPEPIRVLVVAAQHGTERAGIEAALRLARDLAAGSLSSLRRRLEVRIVPMANPRGVEGRRRDTPDGIDLDADHVRLAAPETRAVWAEYAAWRPHVVLDLHELGPSEYGLQAAVPTHPNAPGATRVSRFYLLPFAANRLARADIRFHEYVATWQDGTTFEASARPAPDSAHADRTWFTPAPPDPATARNAFGLAGSAVLYLAVPSSRDILGLEERTNRLQLAIEALLEAAAALASDLDASFVAAHEVPKGELALAARYVSGDTNATMPWLFVNDRGQSEQARLVPWRPVLEVESSLPVPIGWWVDREATALVESLRAHGFTVDEAGPRSDSESTDGRIAGSEPTRAQAYLGCGPALEERRPPDDALWVPTDQAGARLLFTLIEPWSAGGWIECGPETDYPVQRVTH